MQALKTRLVSILISEKGQQHNVAIEDQRPTLNVVEIEADTLIEISVAAPSVDRRPPGHSGFNRMPHVVILNAVLEVLGELRPLGSGPDKAHVAFQDIPELGQLIDVPFAKSFHLVERIAQYLMNGKAFTSDE